MTKGRKTTQEERGEIVAFCIEHGKDYPLTIRTYGVSYQQIYAWVRKYEEKGIDGLRDGRGRTRPTDEMSAEERLRMENRILKAQLKDAEMENKLLKKLRELRGGDGSAEEGRRITTKQYKTYTYPKNTPLKSCAEDYM